MRHTPLIVLVMSAFPLVAAPQNDDAAHGFPRFDVVSVKPVSSVRCGNWDFLPENGIWMGRTMTIQDIVAYAYRVPRDRVEGVPKALQEPHCFTIIAKMPLTTSRKDFFLMMRAMLADRFNAVAQSEVRDVQVSTIEVAKGGAKLRAPSGLCVETDGNEPLPAGQHRCHEVETRPSMSQEGTITWEYSGWSVSMADLAEMLTTRSPSEMEVDETGLPGLYDFDVRIESHGGEDDFERLNNYRSAWIQSWEKQAGLVIDMWTTKKRPGTVVVVDHVELPSPN